MQNPSNSKDRISPDITCLSYNSGQTSPVVSSNAVGTPAGANSNSSLMSSISEVPPGLYEFVVGSNGEVRILCKICQYMSNKKSNFKRHFTNMHFVHNEESSKSLECCGIRFSTKGEKFQHTKSVHKSGYKCTICSKVFDRPALLQRHLAKHTGKKPYKCSLCSYQTPNKANAKRHIEKKHSDVQEGSILFVTDDGEQIQMEVVSKCMRDVEQRSFIPFPCMQSPTTAVVKSNADSTSFSSSTVDMTIPISGSINLPRSRSASVTSSSLSPPGHLYVGPLTSVFDTSAADYEQEKKRKITHSVDMIMKQHAQSHFNFGNGAEGASSTKACCTPQQINEGNVVSASAGQENPVFGMCSSSYNNRSNMNELQLGSYGSPNWSHLSSPFSLNNEHTEIHRSQQQSGSSLFQESGTYSSTSTSTNDIRNQSSQSIVFRQCTHGCWHHVDNQVASDFSSITKNYSSSSHTFVPTTHFFPHPSPDLRSSSSSLSHHTENSSIISVKSEDDNDSDIIDVVGDDEEDDEDGADESCRKLQMLSSICAGLDSFSTAETPTQADDDGSGGNETDQTCSPPVECTSRRSSRDVSAKEEVNTAQEYVPKKLRATRAFIK